MAVVEGAEVSIRGSFETRHGIQTFSYFQCCNKNALNFVQDILIGKGNFSKAVFKIDPESDFAFNLVEENKGVDALKFYKGWLEGDSLQVMENGYWTDIPCVLEIDCPLSFFLDEFDGKIQLKALLHRFYISVDALDGIKVGLNFQPVDGVGMWFPDDYEPEEVNWIRTSKLAYL